MEIFHVYYVLMNIIDIEGVAESAATVTTTLEALVRTYCMTFKKEIINDILYKTWKHFWPLNILPPKKVKEMKNLLYFGCSLTYGFFLMSFVSTSQITSLSFIRGDGLILKSKFPFNSDKDFIYETVYIWQYFLTWFVQVIVNAFDFLFIPLVLICACQYLVLQEVLRHLLDPEKSGVHRRKIFGKNWWKLSNNDVFLECIKQHRLLIGISKKLESSFNLIILIQFFNSICAICLSTFVLQFGKVRGIKMPTYLTAHLLQLFYYCLVGNELTYNSGQLSKGIFECDWHLVYDLDFRRALILMMARSQRNEFLTAGNLTQLNFTSFLMVLRLSFSVNTFLKNFASTEN
nr:odorant receptor 82a-like [Onthophagus taurus]